jgi:hypothetical protein
MLGELRLLRVAFTVLLGAAAVPRSAVKLALSQFRW